MGGVKRSQITTWIVAIIFFLLTAGIFIGMLLRLDSVMAQTDTKGKALYVLTDSDYEDIVGNNGTIVFRTEQIIQEEIYRQQTVQVVRSAVLRLSLAFLAALLIISLFLAWLLTAIRNHEFVHIAEQLRTITETDQVAENTVLSSAYANVRQQILDNLNDYQRLSSYLSHEQKNILAILRAELESNGQMQCLHLIDDMTDGINDVLTLSENRGDDSLGIVDVSLVCAKVCDDYRHLSNQIVFSFHEESDTEIRARERWIYRAVANLLSNAVKYGNGKPIHVSVYTQKGSVIVKVKDHGIGISPEKQESIFSHNYRIDELNKDGYGIGLSVVSHVCDLCGGFVTLESELGKGSVFYLAFPQSNL